MKIKEFHTFGGTPEHALREISTLIDEFFKGDRSIVVTSLSHSIIQIEKTHPDDAGYMVSALLCYK